MATRHPKRAPGPVILDYCGGGLPLFWFGGGGGVVPLGGGGALGLGLALGGGFCSGAPPGCELGLAGGGACSLDGGVFGGVVSLGGELADPPGLFDCWCEQAPADSASAATHSNNRLRFIGSPLKGSRQTEARRRKPRSTSGRRSPGDPWTGADYFLAVARFRLLAGSLARDLPKEPR